MEKSNGNWQGDDLIEDRATNSVTTLKNGEKGQLQTLPDFKSCDSGTVPIWKWETAISEL